MGMNLRQVAMVMMLVYAASGKSVLEKREFEEEDELNGILGELDGEQMECDFMACPDLVCVDPVMSVGDCCPRCPKGGTCWLGDQVTASGTTVVLPSGTPNCPILCRCPAGYIYEREQLNTHAECHLSCASSLRLSPEILRKYYSGSDNNNNPLNWRKKREAEMAANQKK